MHCKGLCGSAKHARWLVAPVELVHMNAMHRVALVPHVQRDERLVVRPLHRTPVGLQPLRPVRPNPEQVAATR